MKIGPKARRAEIDRKNKEALEGKLKNMALCFFYGKDRSVTNKLCRVFTDKRREAHVLWRYVRFKGMRYYLNMENVQSQSLYMAFPPDQRIKVPVLCLHFFEGWQEEMDVTKLVTVRPAR